MADNEPQAKRKKVTDEVTPSLPSLNQQTLNEILYNWSDAVPIDATVPALDSAIHFYAVRTKPNVPADPKSAFDVFYVPSDE